MTDPAGPGSTVSAEIAAQRPPEGPPRARSGPEQSDAAGGAGSEFAARCDAGPPPGLAFRLGELTSTPEALAAAHGAGLQVVALVLRHLGCDWGDVDPAAAAGNDAAVVAGGDLRSAYRLAGGATVVVTTGAGRHNTSVQLA